MTCQDQLWVSSKLSRRSLFKRLEDFFRGNSLGCLPVVSAWSVLVDYPISLNLDGQRESVVITSDCRSHQSVIPLLTHLAQLPHWMELQRLGSDQWLQQRPDTVENPLLIVAWIYQNRPCKGLDNIPKHLLQLTEKETMRQRWERKWKD